MYIYFIIELIFWLMYDIFCLFFVEMLWKNLIINITQKFILHLMEVGICILQKK